MLISPQPIDDSAIQNRSGWAARLSRLPRVLCCREARQVDESWSRWVAVSGSRVAVPKRAPLFGSAGRQAAPRPTTSLLSSQQQQRCKTVACIPIPAAVCISPSLSLSPFLASIMHKSTNKYTQQIVCRPTLPTLPLPYPHFCLWISPILGKVPLNTIRHSDHEAVRSGYMRALLSASLSRI